HLTLLEALASLKSMDWHLDLIGDGPRRPHIMSRVRELGLHKRITFLGEVANVPRLLSEYSIFVLTSRWEGLPISVLEAISVGLPVVASDVGGCSEVIEEGINGFLVPKGDIALLRSRLAALIASPNLRMSFGQQSRERFMRDFRLEQML